MSKKKREDSLEEALGETMHKEGVMEKEKIAKENERLQARVTQKCISHFPDYSLGIRLGLSIVVPDEIN